LLPYPLTVTTTLPDVTPVGTNTVTELLNQVPETTVAAVVPIVTVLEPCEAPNPNPAIVNPVEPDSLTSARLVIWGTTVKGSSILETPLTVTLTS
jgi:hypothetical protein